MSDTQQTPVDNSATNSVASETVAPAPVAGDTQGSAPASEVTSAPLATPEGQEPEKQSRREARAYAANRREIRELHRQLGYMQAHIEGLRTPAQAAEGEQGSPQRQTRAPSPVDQAQAELNRSILGTIEDAGEEYEAVVEKITADGFPMTVPMRDFLATSDKPAEMARWLADNPKEAARISLLGDRAADRALEKAELGLKTAAKSAPKNSTAPPPVPTVGGRSTPSFDPQKASMDDYAAEWKRSRGIK